MGGGCKGWVHINRYMGGGCKGLVHINRYMGGGCKGWVHINRYMGEDARVGFTLIGTWGRMQGLGSH